LVLLSGTPKKPPGANGVKLTDQLKAELQRQAEEINQLEYGELVFRVQKGKVVHWDVRKTFKAGADPKNGKSGA